MSCQTTFKDSRSVTSSLELEFGPSLFAALDGRIIDQSGREVAHASLSARQALELGMRTKGTFGQALPGSSSSVNLQSSLESKLQTRLSTLGSTLYKLTWKLWATPSGLFRSRLRASALRTSAIEPIGYRKGWATPKACDSRGSAGARASKANEELPNAAALAGWPTATATDAIKQGNVSARPGMMGLSETVSTLRYNPRPARLTGYGLVLTGCSARMEGGGQLNPAHSRWLMGLPQEWDDCAPTETLSTLKRRKSS